MVVNNSTNTNYHPSSQIIEHKTDHEIYISSGLGQAETMWQS
jgi:hypothetical protein